MTPVSSILRPHWIAALVLGLVAGCVIAVPQLVAEYRMGSAYQGVHPLTVDDELYYMARAHETLDGHPILGNPYFSEDKNAPGVQFWIPDALLASVSLFLFHDLYAGSIFWDFVLPFLDIIAAYALLYSLTRRSELSLSLAALPILGLFFISFNRSPHPQSIFLLLFACIALFHMLHTRRWQWLSLAALLGGVLFYVYPFFWTYWVVVVAVAATGSLMVPGGREAAAKYVLVLLGALVIAVPYFHDQYVATRLPYYKEALARIGVIYTHFPSGLLVVGVAFATLLVMAYMWWKRLLPHDLTTVLVGACVLAGAIVMNQHVITGLNFQFTVHYTMPALFMCIIAFGYMVVHALDKPVYGGPSPLLLRIITVGCVLIVLINLVPTVLHVSTPQASDVSVERYGPVLAWLDAHTQTDAVVYGDERFSSYVPAYTRDNVVFSPWAEQTYVSNADIYNRFLAVHYFDASFASTTVIAHESEVFGAYYVGQYQHLTMENKLRKLLHFPLLPIERYPDAVVAQLVTRETQLQKGTFDSALQGYRADYLVWDRKTHPDWQVARTSGLAQVFTANDLAVYRIATTSP